MLSPLLVSFVLFGSFLPVLAQTDDDADDENETNYFYFAVYTIYFVGIMVVMFIFDRFGLLDKKVSNLGKAAYEAFSNTEMVDILNKKNVKRPADAPPKVESPIERDGGADAPSQAHSSSCCGVCDCCCHCCCCCCCRNLAVVPVGSDGTAVANTTKQSCTNRFLFGKEDNDNYNAYFRRKLISGDTYFGCPGNLVCCYGLSNPLMADFIFFSLNNHCVMSMFSASLSNPFSRNERKMAFFVQHCMAFFLAATITNAGADPLTKVLLNAFVIVPITLIINNSFYMVLTCPCLINDYQWAVCRWCSSCLEWLGGTIAYPMCLLSVFFLLLSASFLSNEDNYESLVSYAYQIHVLSIFSDVMLTSFKFRTNDYTAFYFCGIPVFSFGQWFKEYCGVHHFVENVDYAISTRSCCGLVKSVHWRRTKVDDSAAREAAARKKKLASREITKRAPGAVYSDDEDDEDLENYTGAAVPKPSGDVAAMFEGAQTGVDKEGAVELTNFVGEPAIVPAATSDNVGEPASEATSVGDEAAAGGKVGETASGKVGEAAAAGGAVVEAVVSGNEGI